MNIDILTALIGFLGVCLTLAITAWAERRAKAQAQLASQKSLLAGLAGELRSNHATLNPYKGLMDLFCASQKGGSRLASLKFASSVTTKIFDANIQNIGILNSREIEKISVAYSYLKMFEAFVARLGQIRTGNTEDDTGHHQFPTLKFDDTKHALRFRLNLKECLDAVTEAIDAISARRSPRA